MSSYAYVYLNASGQTVSVSSIDYTGPWSATVAYTAASAAVAAVGSALYICIGDNTGQPPGFSENWSLLIPLNGPAQPLPGGVIHGIGSPVDNGFTAVYGSVYVDDSTGNQWTVSNLAWVLQQTTPIPINASYRFSGPNFQIYDAGYAAWVTIVSVNGVLGTSAPTS